MPPVWINEDGQLAQTRPCPRPGCGREVPIRRYRYETLCQIGSPLFRVARYVECADRGKSWSGAGWGGVGVARARDRHGKV